MCSSKANRPRCGVGDLAACVGATRTRSARSAGSVCGCRSRGRKSSTISCDQRLRARSEPGV